MRTYFAHLLVFSLLAGAIPVDAAPADSMATWQPDPTLAATSDTPWVPPAPVRAAETWESVLRFPGRVVTLPLSLVGAGVEGTLSWAEDQAALQRLAQFFVWQQRIGVTAGSASLGDGAGFGGAIAWSPPPLGRTLSAEFSATTLKYNRTRIAAHAGPVAAEYTNEWRPEDPFFGFGMGARMEDESHYAVHHEAVRLTATARMGRAPKAAETALAEMIAGTGDAPRAPFEASVWAGPASMRLSHGRSADDPSFDERFPELAAQAGRSVEHLVYGGRIAIDRRGGRPHWTHGWQGSVSAERFDRAIETLAIRDAHPDARAFTRLNYELEGGVSFWRDPRTIRLRLEAVDQVLSGGGAFLVPSLSKLGASEGLDGFEAGRFHDLDLLLGRLGYIFPLGKNLEFEWYTEAGGVFPEFRAARIAAFETSYGGVLRIRGDAAMLGMVGLAWSREGARIRFSIGGVE